MTMKMDATCDAEKQHVPVCKCTQCDILENVSPMKRFSTCYLHSMVQNQRYTQQILENREANIR